MTITSTVRKLNFTQRVWARVSMAPWCFRRKLRFLVWYDDEIDICVTFTEDRLGALRKAQQALSELGINFDMSTTFNRNGWQGRDWEWDWSLQGPVHIKFRSRAKRPERRF